MVSGVEGEMSVEACSSRGERWEMVITWCTAVVEVKIVRSRLISEFFGGDMDGTCG